MRYFKLFYVRLFYNVKWYTNNFQSTGSIFTQAFCNKLKQEYKLNSNSENEDDLEFILTNKKSVQDIMNSYLTGQKEQIFTWDTSLRKLIKFRKIKPIKTHPTIISQLYPFFDFLAPIIVFILLFQFTGVYSPRRWNVLIYHLRLWQYYWCHRFLTVGPQNTYILNGTVFPCNKFEW